MGFRVFVVSDSEIRLFWENRTEARDRKGADFDQKLRVCVLFEVVALFLF